MLAAGSLLPIEFFLTEAMILQPIYKLFMAVFGG
jgi:hypothetical protein